MTTTSQLRIDSPPVEIHDLKKSFGRTRALDGLDLTVEHGSIAGFLGPRAAPPGYSAAIPGETRWPCTAGSPTSRAM
jgi:Fe-S cluster assembly ATPase SufC